jgi:hypothetical protein
MEFVKEKILSWYEKNINIFDLPFDRVGEFNEIKRIVTDYYNSDRVKNEAKVEKAIIQYREQTGKSLDKDLMLKKKAVELFGSTMIIIYNRFVDRTLFK